MQSTLKEADPHDIFAIEPDLRPARAEHAGPTLAPAGAVAAEHREPYFGPSSAPSPAASVMSGPPPAPVPPAIAAAIAGPTVPPVSAAPSVAAVPPAAPYHPAATGDIRLDDIK